jgi:hypothetical protein
MKLSDLEKINHHVFQPIKISSYEQGNEYHQKPVKNSYIQVATTLSNNNQSARAIQPYFNLILEVEEGHNVIDYAKVKKEFFENVSTEVLKSISKKHVVLKQDLFDFVYNTEVDVPKNKNVMDLVCVLNKKSYIIVKGNRFNVYINDDHQETVILYDKSNEYCVRMPNVHEGKVLLIAKGYIENVHLKALKLVDLKAYAFSNGITIDNLKKKDEIVDTIERYIKNKN